MPKWLKKVARPWGSMKPDELDRALTSMSQEDGRLSFAEIGKSLN